MSEEYLLNCWGLPETPPRETERDYEDWRHPGKKIRLRLRELDPFTRLDASRRYGEYWERFCKPRPPAAAGQPAGPPPPFLGPDGKPRQLNEIVIDQIATLETMQVPAEGQPPRGLPEWVSILAKMPDAFAAMVAESYTLNAPPKKPDDGPGNAGRLSPSESSSEEPSLDPPSSSGSPTPTSP